MLGGNELVDSMCVKRIVNDLSFQFELKQPCTHIFKLTKTTFFHACLAYPKSKDCQWFKILTRSMTNRQFCDNCLIHSKKPAVMWKKERN